MNAVRNGGKKNYAVESWQWDEEQLIWVIGVSIEYDDIWDYEYSDSQGCCSLVVDKSVELLTSADTSAPVVLGVANSTNGVTVKWKANAGVAKYAVFRKTDSGKWTKIAEVNGISYLDGTTKAGHTYGYTVRGINEAGKYITSYDTVGKSVTISAIDTSAPVVLGVTNGDSGVTVTWKANSGVAKYVVFRKTDSGKWTKIAETTGNGNTTAEAGSTCGYVDGTAEAGHTYAYTVRGINAAGKYITSYDTKGKSVKITAAIDTNAPVVLGAVNGANGVTVTWKANSGVANYAVFRKTDSGKWIKIAETTGNGNATAEAGLTCSYIDGTAEAGHTYAYTVRGINAAGKYVTSFDATGKSVTVDENQQEVLDASSPVLGGASAGDNGITVTWTANSGVPKYAVFRKVAGGKWTKVGVTTGSGNEGVKAAAGSACSFVDGSVAAGKTYIYTVRGLGEDGKYVTNFDANGVSATAK